MTDTLGIVRNYDDLRTVLRKVAETRNISREEIDRLAGWPTGFAGKVLANQPTRNLGATTLAGGLGALGVMLIAVEDPEALAKYTVRAEQRDGKQVRMLTPVSITPKMRFITNKTARKMRRLGVKKISPARRRTIARIAANARWKRRRLKRVQRAVLPPCVDTPLVI